MTESKPDRVGGNHDGELNGVGDVAFAYSTPWTCNGDCNVTRKLREDFAAVVAERDQARESVRVGLPIVNDLRVRAEKAEAVIHRISDIAGEAIGTDPSLRDTPKTTVAVVEVLAQRADYCSQLALECARKASRAENDRFTLRILLLDVLAWKVDGSGFEYQSSTVDECIRQGANVGKMHEEEARKMGLASAEDHRALLARLREAGVVE